LHGANEVGVGDLATGRDLMGMNENHGVVAEDLVANGAGFGEALCSGPTRWKGKWTRSGNQFRGGESRCFRACQ
jgi:hypothetical protein